MKQTHSKTGARESVADDDRLEEDWPDEDWEDSEPEYDIEYGLPYGAESFVNSGRLLTLLKFNANRIRSSKSIWLSVTGRP